MPETLNPYAELTEEQTDAYDSAIAIIRNQLGSFDKIGQLLYGVTSEHTSHQTVRTWFALRSVPEKVVLVLYELTEGNFDAFDLMPWMRDFMETHIYPTMNEDVDWLDG